MEEGLKIRIGADISDAEKGLKTVNQRVAETATNVKRVSSSIKGFGFDDEFVKRANAAKNATISFNQVLREVPNFAIDARIGLTSLSNNLPQVADGFKGLRQAGVSTGQAIGIMAKQILSAGNLITLGLTVLISFREQLFGVSKEAKKAAEELEELTKPIGDIIAEGSGKIQGQVAEVNALVGVLREKTLTDQEQQRVVNELTKINKAYFGDLKVGKDLLQQATAAQQEYTAAIVQQAVIENLKSEIGKVGAELFKQKQEIQNNVTSQRELTNALIAQNKAVIDSNAQQGVRTFFLNEQANQIGSITDRIKKQQKAAEPLQKQFDALTNSINQAIVTSLKFREVDPLKEKKTRKSKFEFDVEVFRISDARIKDGADRLRELTQAELKAKPIQIGAPIFTEQFFISPNTIAAIDELNKKVQESQAKATKQGREVLKQLNQQITEANLERLANIVAGPVTDAFSGLFDTILTEGTVSLDAIGNAIRQVVKELISAVAKAFVFQAIISLFTGQNFFKGLTSRLGLLNSIEAPKLATGGIVTKPTLAVVGEGRESEAVLPLSQLDALLSSSGGNETLTTAVSGDQLLFVLNRAGRRQGRSF